MVNNELLEYKEFAVQLAAESGKIIRKYFRKPITIDVKADDSPVTIADRQAEAFMRRRITETYPEHGIMGEEFGIHNPDAVFQWILDPIDGTKSFICGAVTFGTLIALLKNGEPMIGLFYQPVLDEMLIGDNHTSELNGQKVSVRECRKLSEAVLLTTDHLNIAKYQDASGFDALTRAVKLYRNWGDCYGYYLLCTGYADIMIDPVMSPWDSLPIIPVVRGAGGTVTDYQGLDPIKGKSMVACTPELHGEVIAMLNPGR